MKNKYKKIAIMGAVLLGIIIGVGCYWHNEIQYKNNATIESSENIEEIIDNNIDAIKDLNKELKSTNLSSNDYYTVNDKYTCYKYIGENEDEYIEKIKDLYVEPFAGAFEITNDELYVCMLSYCKNIADLKSYSIINDDEDEKVVEINYENLTGTYIMKKVDDKWKFVIPIINCE